MVSIAWVMAGFAPSTNGRFSLVHRGPDDGKKRPAIARAVHAARPRSGPVGFGGFVTGHGAVRLGRVHKPKRR